MLHLAEILGVVFGILGALLVTSNQRYLRFLAFNSWIISNIFLVLFYVLNQHYGLVFLGSIYMITSCIGWWNNRKD